MVLITIQLIIIVAIFRWEPIDFSIKAVKDKDAVKMCQLLYTSKSDETAFTKYVEARRVEL